MISTTTGLFCFPQAIHYSQYWPLYPAMHCGLIGPNQFLAVCNSIASVDIITAYLEI